MNEAVGQVLDRHRDTDALYRQNARTRAEIRTEYDKCDECQRCSVRSICDGFHRDYFEMFGMGEARAIRTQQRVDDPLYYIRRQQKVVVTSTPDDAIAAHERARNATLCDAQR